jgi:hypothetical protein
MVYENVVHILPFLKVLGYNDKMLILLLGATRCYPSARDKETKNLVWKSREVYVGKT